MAGFKIVLYFSTHWYFLERSQEKSQKLIDPRSAPIQIPVIVSSMPSHLVRVTPKAAPATQSGQCALTLLVLTNRYENIKRGSKYAAILNFVMCFDLIILNVYNSSLKVKVLISRIEK